MNANPTDMSERGLRMLAGFEATILHLYYDVAGILTVCTGHVVLPGEDWSTVTADKCEAALGRDVGRFVRAFLRAVKVPFTQPMLDAGSSLAFNIGEAAFEASSVVRLMNQKEYEAAADAFKLWQFARVKQKDGSFLKKPVLLGRRLAEADVFRGGIALLGGAPAPETSLEELIQMAVAKEFDLRATLHDGPAGIEDDEPVDNDERADDGRIVAIPPAIEELAA